MTSAGGAPAPRAPIAAIDIGTNSVLLLIVAPTPGGLVRRVDRATITRLGEGVDRTRRLRAEAVERTLSCLRDYAAELRAHGVMQLAVVATSAMRDASGGDDFLDRAAALLGTRPQVIAGDTEAELTFEGALSGLTVSGPVTVFDVGGGSTEIIVGHANTAAQLGRPEDAISLDIGSVRLFERHVRADPPSDDELARVDADIRDALARAPRTSAASTLVGVAGTVTTLAAVELGLDPYDGERVHGHVMSRDAVIGVSERLAALSLAERRALSGLEPKRADVIVVGAQIVRCVLSWSGASELVVSDRGVRWGLVQRLAAA